MVFNPGLFASCAGWPVSSPRGLAVSLSGSTLHSRRASGLGASAATVYFRASEGQRNSGERGGSGAAFGGDTGRLAREAVASRVPRLVETGWASLSPHPSSCRFAGPPRRHPYYGPSLWLLGAAPCRDSPLSGARTPRPLQSWAKKWSSLQTPLPTTPSGRWLSL